MNFIQKDFNLENERKVIANEAFTWGKLHIPSVKDNPSKTKDGLRVLFIGSTSHGSTILETLKAYENAFPDKLNLVGLVTDDPTDTNAKISANKRLWRYFSDFEKHYWVNAMIQTGLEHGLPCFTGNVKSNYFYEALNILKPELILVCIFGQIISQPVFDFPTYGSYNFHPSDLSNQIGAGPNPYEETIKANEFASSYTLHKVNEILDGGPIVGSSPKINIQYYDGTYPIDFRDIHEKMEGPLGWMTLAVLYELFKRKNQADFRKLEEINFDQFMIKSIKKWFLRPIPKPASIYTT